MLDMEQQEEKRGQWAPVVARFEQAGKSQQAFTAEAGVSLPGFRYWLYKIRREGRPVLAKKAVRRRKATGSAKAVRLVPVEVRHATASMGQVEVRIAGVRIRVPVGTDPGYLARVALALQGSAAC